MISVLDLFSEAAGGWSLGMHRAGYRTIAACEVIDWRRALYSENNPGVPVYDDVTTLTADRLIRDGVGLPDIVVGSPPCQDISSANTKGKGVDGERSSLYFEAVRIIDECRPRWFALENSANLRTRGADRVIDALAAIGYACWPFVVSAGDIGANHERKRSWLIGYDGNSDGKPGSAWIRASAHEGPHDQFGGRLRQVAESGRDGAFHYADATEVGRASWAGDNESHGRKDNGRIAGNDNGHGRAAVGADTIGQRLQGIVGSDEQRQGQEPERADLPSGSEMGGSSCPSPTPAEPWADWNGGLAHHLRVDDGVSGWVAQSRIAVGGPRGTVAASLIVEAFGDAVCPQIPEAIGRAIIRVERALAAITKNEKPVAANNNDNDGVRDEKADENQLAA
ncbi:DNA cytosine methyltransferase [Rhizobium ruizarguesonis]|uniref:DNA cytosine methyltransferase n=1 Tax=Rhizobium ruizarguesonis TaxID=2081791 RepID=A0ACD5EMJ0_9HYPH|nr:DNA cytosine methyltransferase [Rhizobium leguminosarum]